MNHLFHSDLTLGYKEYLKENQEIINNLNTCFECLVNYQKYYLKFQENSSQRKEIDCKRLVDSLKFILQKSNSQDIKNRILFVLYEILTDPTYLLQEEIQNLLDKLLKLIENFPGLRLSDKILPGILLLKMSKNENFAAWADTILRKKNLFTLSDYDEKNFFNIIFKKLKRQDTEWDRFISTTEMMNLLIYLSKIMDNSGIKLRVKNSYFKTFNRLFRIFICFAEIFKWNIYKLQFIFTNLYEFDY